MSLLRAVKFSFGVFLTCLSLLIMLVAFSGCGPLGRKIGSDLAACAIDTTLKAATDIAGKLESPDTEWDGYVAASLAIKGGANFLYCGIVHLLQDLSSDRVADLNPVPRRCHQTKQRHRSRLINTLNKVILIGRY